jgi:hypothetical protein
MKINMKLTFAALAVVAAVLLFQTPITQADGHLRRGGDNERRDRDHRDAKVNFTKWVTAFPNEPGLVASMEGIVGRGDAGHGTFAGEVLKWDTSGDIIDIVAFYHFTGSKHSFSAIVHVLQPKTSTRGVITGVVTEGWLKGHALKGEYTVIDVGPNPYGADLPVPYIPVTLVIDGDCND